MHDMCKKRKINAMSSFELLIHLFLESSSFILPQQNKTKCWEYGLVIINSVNIICFGNQYYKIATSLLKNEYWLYNNKKLCTYCILSAPDTLILQHFFLFPGILKFLLPFLGPKMCSHSSFHFRKDIRMITINFVQKT